ncbi:glycosyltransferase family 2 protein [Shewanella sp. UCD-KL12]|uniref:glycosyltransferase family 2 protein n=1 Tax=Shewanella sp. UCD-KL12 TaxID=1917163 RepID=UPI000971091F
MRTSLIITTYNWPEALEAVLNSVAKQTRLPDEVIIADDGSKEATVQLIKKMAKSFPVPLIHSWQEDLGFRLSRSRNKAIHLASMDYIVMIDGDMILNKHFIADHIKVAEPGFFITGKRVKLGEKLSLKVLNQHASLSFFTSGISRGRELCLRSSVLQSMYCNSRPYSIDGIHGCNLAFWRQDVIAVNGFNAEFEGWGPEDKEFALRMINNGILRKQIKFYGVAFHLNHHESSKEQLEENERIFQNIKNNHIICCQRGLCEFINTWKGEQNSCKPLY